MFNEPTITWTQPKEYCSIAGKQVKQVDAFTV